MNHYDSSVSSVLGTSGDFEMLVEGRLEEGTITGTGTLVNDSTAIFEVKLTKRPPAPAV